MSGIRTLYIASFAAKRDMFHAFFGTFDESEMNIEYEHPQSSFPGFQIEAITTNQVDPLQDSELCMTVVLQVLPIAQGAGSSMEDLIRSQVPGSQVAVLPSIQMSTSFVPQPTLPTSHVEGSRTDIMTRSHQRQRSAIWASERRPVWWPERPNSDQSGDCDSSLHSGLNWSLYSWMHYASTVSMFNFGSVRLSWGVHTRNVIH